MFIGKITLDCVTETTIRFDGQFIRGSALSLSNFERCIPCSSGRLVTNQQIMIKTKTFHKHSKEELIQWLALNEDFSARNLTEWLEIQNTLFPWVLQRMLNGQEEEYY
ncbi:hypothetical protein KIF59_01160 [Enterobacter cloacae subsp. cloacae]|nr:hypothetical protein [Enterobacter cloacae subsp. cloacae]